MSGHASNKTFTFRSRVGVSLLFGLLFTQMLFAQSLTPLGSTTQTTAGLFHTCALSSTGGVKCWGSNRAGQLGTRDSAPNQRETPIDVFGLESGVIAISAGRLHTCAVLTSGVIRCWGDNSAGQLGDGTTITRPLPTTVVDLGGIAVSVSAGESHTCALLASGGIRCWGSNEFGQLGDGTSAGQLRPTPIASLSSGVTQVGAGHHHTCAVRDGSAFCWGRNEDGQLGNSAFGSELTPVAVIGLNSGMKEVVGGRAHTCGLSLSGAVSCWGSNTEGQLGIGSRESARSPRPLVDLTSGVSQISTNFEHSCALLQNGGVRCWGDNFYGQIGDATSIDRTRPTDVLDIQSGFKLISAGFLHSCAVNIEGTTKCWGNNFDGQLGNGQFTNRLTPRQVVGLAVGVEKIGSGFQHSCAWSASRGTFCWGDNTFGQLGTGNLVSSESPAAVQQLSNGNGSIAGGVYHTCSLTTANGLRCWGRNDRGQVGDGSFVDRVLPVDVSGLGSGVASLATGGFHTCVALADGTVRCWGSNVSGQLGIGVTGDIGQPAEVGALASPVASVSAGEAHTCALTRSGAVLCWGSNTSGQLGDGTIDFRAVPTPVIGLSGGVSAISVSGNFSCALMQLGAVKCWGANESGQLGDGSTTARRAPTPVIGLSSGVTQIEAAWYHACAISQSGSLRCWGRNTEGQLGDNSTIQRQSPTQVAGFNGGVTTNSGGGGQNCFLFQGGSLRCWGANNFGQIGDGTSWGVRRPVLVQVDVLGLAIASVTPAADNVSSAAAIDATGRFVVFQSRASNLVAGDTNQSTDIFRRDLQSGVVTRVSIGNDGSQISGDANQPSVTGDGQIIAFVAPDSAVGALLNEPAFKRRDRQKASGSGLFLRNALTGSTQRVGAPSGSAVTAPNLARNGRSIVWTQPISDPAQGLVGQSNIFRSTLTPVAGGSIEIGMPQCLTCRTLTPAGQVSAQPSNGESRNGTLSSDGNWLVWESTATNTEIGPGGKSSPCPSNSIVLLRNLLTGHTRSASTPNATGSCGNPTQGATVPSVADGGTAVAFESNQPLVNSDTNGVSDIYRWDVDTGSLTRVSVGENGADPNGASTSPDLSADGTTIAFTSSASNLDTSFADNNDLSDIHVAQKAGGIARLSRSDTGGEASRPSNAPAVSADGRQLAFESSAGNLAPGAIANQTGVFVRSNPLAASANSSPNRSSVWWRPEESGWGLLTNDQGNVISVGWFTYDVDGEPTWNVGAALPQADGSYMGEVFRNTGVPLTQITGIATETTVKIADITLRYQQGNRLQFDYQLVGGPRQSKSLERFSFGLRGNICTSATASQRLASTNYSDVWWGGSETSGWGLFMTQVDAQLYFSWFTYDTDREAVFLNGASDRQPDGSFLGSIFRPRNGTPLALINNAPASSGTDLVGSFSFTPLNGVSAQFNYTTNGVSQSKRVERFVFGSTPMNCVTTSVSPPAD